MEHNRFVVETMSFCQGNCSGCFFSESERVGGSFMNSNDLKKVVSFIMNKARGMSDVSINFGQGDHLAIKDSEWDDFLFHMKQFKEISPLITVSTSAIEKTEVVKKRVDQLHDLAIQEQMKIFFAVVLDPKKLEHQTFKNRYVENINYMRSKFGVIDLTINVGEDTLKHMPPDKLDSFLIEHKFRHLELNLIPTVNTVYKFSAVYKDILNWFIKLRELSVNKPYLVYHHYQFNYMQNKMESLPLMMIKKELLTSLLGNFYIDSDLNVSSILYGYTGNAVPITRKTGYAVNRHIDGFCDEEFKREQNKLALNLSKPIFTDKSCSSCKYNKLCVMSGTMVFRNNEYKDLHKEDGCFIGVDELWSACSKAKDLKMGVDVNLIPKGLKQENSFGLDEV